VIGGSLLLNGIRSMFSQHSRGQQPSRGFLGDSASPWSNKADARDAASDPARGIGAEKPSDQGYDAQNDQRGDVNTLADTDDEYDVDDSDELSEDDLTAMIRTAIATTCEQRLTLHGL
jgi:hypothetical protein